MLLEAAPVDMNSPRKNAASRRVTPMAAKTTTTSVSSSGARVWAAIRAARALAGKPAPEKIGSFWPRTNVMRPSMAETPSRGTGWGGRERSG